MNNKIGFALPNMYETFKLNQKIISLFEYENHIFYDDIVFDAFYGNFQYCIWEGGRIFPYYNIATLETVEKIKNFYNDKHIPIRLIFTNSQLKEQHLDDHYCNLIARECEDEINEIVVNSSLLEQYLRTNYSKYKIISSTTKCLIDKQQIHSELKKDYFRLCLDYNLNHDYNFLKTLSNNEKNKIEFLVNAICGANCINRQNHYKLLSLSNLNYCKNYTLKSCEIYNDVCYPSNNTTHIEYNDIQTIYKLLNFYHYKIEGRAVKNTSINITSLTKYLIKPEYQLYVINKLNE